MRAGYPLASELISVTEEFVHSEREVMRRTYWNRWESWRRNAEGIVVADLRGPNTAERSCRRGLNARQALTDDASTASADAAAIKSRTARDRSGA